MSTYPVLDNKPIDQWKVTELKEELKRRRLPVKGLKDDLIRRLDEALHAESESTKESIDDGIDDGSTAVDAAEIATDGVDESGNRNEETGDARDAVGKRGDIVNESDNTKEETGDIIVESDNSKIELGDSDKIPVDEDDDLGSPGKENVLEDESVGGTDYTVVEAESTLSVETTIVETEATVSESVVTETVLSGQDLQNNETQNKEEESNSELENEDSKPSEEEAKLESSDVNNQVFEVSQVKSDSISTDTTVTTSTVTINEKNEQLKDNVIADDVKLELDVKPSSSDNIVVDGGKLLAMDVDELQLEENNKVTSGEGTGGNDADMGKKNESGDVGSAEKLNLDRSSGEDSMEEDGLESKETDLKFKSDECVKTEVTVVKEEEGAVDVTVDDISAEKKSVIFENKNGHALPDAKRKFNVGQESGGNSESTKRQRRWNSEGLKVGELQSVNLLSPSSTTTTPKDAAFQPTAMAKRNFSRSDSMAAEEPPKERVVPPSSKPSTNSLRIDRFLRPFTLKAVQELLGKTGSVTSFWMDHIKTHCYVTYSSVEESVETRNAVYNLQWPPNGGRLLVAEFVDPQEVKTRVEAPPPSPATPTTTTPTLPPPPAATTIKKPSPALSPRLPVQRQQLPPPPSLPPPPPLSNPPPLREQPLPPPPPLPERVEPPIVTLDDLFRKTKAIPRIYYLPLSDEQVAEKAKAQGKIATNE